MKIIILLLTIGFIFIFWNRSSVSVAVPKLNLLSPSFDKITSLDTQKIQYADQYEFLRALFATLVFYDEDGKIKSGLASEFGINGNVAWFRIRDNVKTIDGYTITSKDVADSIKRHLILGKAAHGRLSSILISCKNFKYIQDDHQAISYTDKIVSFHLKKPDYYKFFIILLTSIDFGIIPSSSINKTSENLGITDFRNTSGAYYLASEGTRGEAVLKANLGHFLLSADSPKVIELIPEWPRMFIDSVEKMEIDVVPTVHRVPPEDIPVIESSNKFNIHQSIPIQLSFVHFTRKGFKKLSKTERIIIGLKLREKLLTIWKHLSPTKEFFGILGDGSLEQEQIETIDKIYKEALGKTLSKDVIIDITFLKRDFTKKLLLNIDRHMKPYEGKEFDYSSVARNRIPDVVIAHTDSGSTDNITLLEYTQSQKHFGLTDKEFEEWLKKYMDTGDVNVRQKMIRDLHFKMLSEGHVIPIGAAPYYAIARKPWKIKAPTIFAGTPLWMIHYEP